jgi:hypothetical protein
VHVLSANIYCSTLDALECFDYIAKHGKSPQLSSSMFPVIHCFFLIMCYQVNFLPFRIVGANACVILLSLERV